MSSSYNDGDSGGSHGMAQRKVSWAGTEEVGEKKKTVAVKPAVKKPDARSMIGSMMKGVRDVSPTHGMKGNCSSYAGGDHHGMAHEKY